MSARNLQHTVDSVKRILQISSTNPEIEDDDIKLIIANSLEGEFTRFSPNILTQEYIGNSQSKRELPQLWLKDFSVVKSVYRSDNLSNFIDRNHYNIVMTDEVQRPINDASRNDTSVTLTDPANASFFVQGTLVAIYKKRDVVQNKIETGSPNSSSLDFLNPYVVGVATVNGSYVSSAVSVADLIEINWVQSDALTTNGIINLVNPLRYDWTDNIVISKAPFIDFRFTGTFSATDRFSVLYTAKHSHTDDFTTVKDKDYSAFVDLSISNVCYSIAARYSTGVSSTFEADAVDYENLAEIWTSKGRAFRSKFTSHFSEEAEGFEFGGSSSRNGGAAAFKDVDLQSGHGLGYSFNPSWRR